VSKAAMDIDGLGEEFVREMVEKGMIRSPADLYRVTGKDLDKFERMGDKLKENILSSIEKSKRVSLERFIYALGIRGVGEKTSKNLARHFKDIHALLKVTPENLIDLDEMGEVASRLIPEYFQHKKNKKLVEDLLSVGVAPFYEEKKAASGVLSGKKVLFTGTISIPRRLAKEKAEAAGAEIVSSISKNTDILIAGADPGSKLTKAKELGVQVITEEEFIRLTEAGQKP
ncbi:MAG: NAD-dependent DNA ligase LigA, partial [Spirochaetia bacterium]|nr:NAD-dependent DNA ligase LigA [Spirochaetia bacterium]